MSDKGLIDPAQVEAGADGLNYLVDGSKLRLLLSFFQHAVDFSTASSMIRLAGSGKQTTRLRNVCQAIFGTGFTPTWSVELLLSLEVTHYV